MKTLEEWNKTVKKLVNFNITEDTIKYLAEQLYEHENADDFRAKTVYYLKFIGAIDILSRQGDLSETEYKKLLSKLVRS